MNTKIREETKRTWPNLVVRTARKDHPCDNGPCRQTIHKGDLYIDPMESNPYRAGGFGGYRFCLQCQGGDPTTVIAEEQTRMNNLWR